MEVFAIAAFSFRVNDVRSDRDLMLDYPVYTVRSSADDTVYTGFALADVFDAVGLYGEYTAMTFTNSAGDSVELNPGDAFLSSTLLALAKDGRRFDAAPGSRPAF